jgi:hypothetical protein
LKISSLIYMTMETAYKYAPYIFLFLGHIFCEIFIREDAFRVGSMTFLNLVFISVYSTQNIKTRILLIVFFAPVMTYLSAGRAPASLFPRGLVLFPLALLTIYKYRKKQKS